MVTQINMNSHLDSPSYPPTIIWRHKKENIIKCSLRGLETRRDIKFFTYPRESLPVLDQYVVLSLDAPLLSEKDRKMGLALIDGTWRYAEKMLHRLPPSVNFRSLPPVATAYPRTQTGCTKPNEGLASIEALYAAYFLLGRPTKGLLDNYYWADLFLDRNCELFSLRQFASTII